MCVLKRAHVQKRADVLTRQPTSALTCRSAPACQSAKHAHVLNQQAHNPPNVSHVLKCSLVEAL